MDLNVADVLKVEKTNVMSKIKSLKGGVQYWMREKEIVDRRLEELIKEFNEVVKDRKYIQSNLASCQADQRKTVDYFEKLNRAIAALEDLEE